MSIDQTISLNTAERKEIKNLIAFVMGEMISDLTDAKRRLEDDDELTEDTETCTPHADDYTMHIHFLTYLYDSEWVSGTPKTLLWEMDTGTREIMWRYLEEQLSPDLFAKIEKCLDSWNHR